MVYVVLTNIITVSSHLQGERFGLFGRKQEAALVSEERPASTTTRSVCLLEPDSIDVHLPFEALSEIVSKVSQSGLRGEYGE